MSRAHFIMIYNKHTELNCCTHDSMPIPTNMKN